MRIDGVGNEVAWRRAHPIDNFAAPWAAAGDQPTTTTHARVLWDDRYLYFLAEMEDAEIVVASERDDDRLWLGDVFELFFKPRMEDRSYYELQVNPANARLDINIRHRTPDAYERWRSSHAFAWETAVNKTATGWIAEGRIPWTDVSPTGGAPRLTETWRFALCRYDYTTNRPPALSTNARLSKANFHRHEEWPSLVFVRSPDDHSESPRPAR